MTSVCNQEILDLKAKGAIVEILDDSPGIYSALFAIPKSTGGYRPIVNLKPLNAFIVYEHFKMESFETAKTLVRKGDWLAKLDLKDAYLTVPFAVEHQKFLRFCLEGRRYQFSCLPFGLCSAPRIFSKIMKADVSFFRKKRGPHGGLSGRYVMFSSR